MSTQLPVRETSPPSQSATGRPSGDVCARIADTRTGSTDARNAGTSKPGPITT